MLDRLIKPARKPLLIAGIALVVAGGFALAMVPTAGPVAKTIFPAKEASPASSASPSATASPAVAGAETTAPTPAAVTKQTAQESRPSAPANSAAPAAKADPCKATGSVVNLTIKYSGQQRTCTLKHSAGIDPCTVLYQARNAGFINSLTIYDSPSYIASHGNSAYLFELDGQKDFWTYKIFAPSGQILPAPGCTLTPIQSGGKVIWSFGD